MKIIEKRIVAGSLMLFAMVWGGQAGEYWVTPDTSYGTDGSGSGTAASPWVRSTATTFDTLITGSAIPPYSSVHLMAGTFHTLGIAGVASPNGLIMKAGWKLRGAGIGNTIIRLDEMFTPPAAGTAWSIVGGIPQYVGQVQDVEVSDLTVDMNVQGQNTANGGSGVCYAAVLLFGDNTKISKVRVENWGSTAAGVENFLLRISSDGTWPIKTNCIIEQCTIGSAAPVQLKDGVTGISIAGYSTPTPGNGWISGSEIRNCIIKNVRTKSTGDIGKPTYFHGIQAGQGAVGSKVIGNYVIDLQDFDSSALLANAFYLECGSIYDLVVEGNMFLDVVGGVYLQGWTGCTDASTVRKNVHIRNNLITLKSGGWAISYGGKYAPRGASSLTIENNMLQAVNGAGSINGISVSATDNVTIENNTIDPNGGTGIQLGAQVNPARVENNRKLDGSLTSTTGWSYDAEKYQVKFTPAQAGWYRLVAGYNQHSGIFNISSDWFDNKITDIEFHYDIPAVASQGDITVVRNMPYNGGHVSKVRISSSPWDGTGYPIYIDIYVPSVTSPGPLTVTWRKGSRDVWMTQFGVVTYLNPDQPGTDSQRTLDLGRGFRTTGPIYAGSPTTQVTDDTGKVLGAALSDDAVTDSKLRNSSGTSVIGRSASGIGDPGDIIATANGQYLRLSGGVLGFGTIAAGELPTHTHAAADIVSGLLGTARLGSSGTPDSTTFLRGDQTWAYALQLANEASSAPVTDTASTATGVTTLRLFDFVTLPATEKLYVITGIEWKNGATVAGDTICGAVLVNAIPPTQAAVPTIAFGQLTANSGANSIQRVSRIVSQPMLGGTTLGIFIQGSSTAQTYRTATVSSANNRKTVSAFPTGGDVPNQENAPWTASTTKAYIKVYYQGYR